MASNQYMEIPLLVVIHALVEAEQPTSFEFYQNGNLKENDAVFLSCSANVGNPGGFVAIWKLNKASNQPIILNKSSEINEKTENCTAVANLNITYIVSRDDNGAIFRCYSQNRQTQEPAPYKDTAAIDVQYGPSKVTIKSSFSHRDLFTGANVNLTCVADGNPVPIFTWKFKTRNVLSDERHYFTLDNRTLILKKMVFNDSGIYSCFASNLVDGEMLKISSSISLKVNEKQKEGHHSKESNTGHAQYEVLNVAEATNTTGTSGTENTRYEVLISREETRILREKNAMNTEYEALKGETSELRKSVVENERYEIVKRTEQANTLESGDTVNARYERLNMAGESNSYEKIQAEHTKYENLQIKRIKKK
ncbi:CD166 antigen-like [Saccostrea echinata]|uniref:CD166 antigen-like n=1 Tax=Saccostrea echinata TaxID=191078 RepID=UPI002A829FD9|nr:CD166 antigen-like [Saccostrea echinata]